MLLYGAGAWGDAVYRENHTGHVQTKFRELIQVVKTDTTVLKTFEIILCGG